MSINVRDQPLLNVDVDNIYNRGSQRTGIQKQSVFG